MVSARDIFTRLPSFCSDRIRSVAELQKFFSLHYKFHHVSKYDRPPPPPNRDIEDNLSNIEPETFRQNLQHLAKHFGQISLLDSAVMSCKARTSQDDDFVTMAPADSIADNDGVIDI